LEGQNASKVETLKSMLENYPETDFGADAKYEVAQTYFFTDKYQDALTWFDKVITDHPNSSYVRKAKLNKGLLYYNQSSDETALPLFEEVAENYPATEEASEALLKIKKIYVERGDVPAFEKYLASKNFPDVTTGALDTSYYESAELMYLRGQLASALVEFDKYRDKFPNGYFKLNANFYAAEAALQLEQYDAAIKSYDKVLEFPKNTFTEKSLIAAGNIYYFQKRYNEALLRYAMLEEVAEVAENLLEARIGLMRCNYLINNFEGANEYSLKLRRMQTAPKEVLDEASLFSAKCALAQNDLKMAEARFKETLLQANNEFGAEAMYNLARIHFLRDSIDRAQSLIFEMVNIFPNYGEWISRSFLLLADTYVKQNDLFQARLTLQNLIDNYGGELKQDAERKLAEVENMQTPLQERMDGAGFEVEFEQEGKVADDLFEIDEEPQEEILIEEAP
jgi:TolA-binding protein